MPDPTTAGLHHVTATSRQAQQTVDFHGRLLGLTLLKATVNFDDPSVWHLYHGDARGTPGSVLTHFPIPGARPARAGTGVASALAWAVVPGAFEVWRERLAAGGVAVAEGRRWGERVLTFADPDGLGLELIGREGAGQGPGALHSVTLTLASSDATAPVLTGVLGLAEADPPAAGGEGRRRFLLPDGGAVDLVETPDLPPARGGVGAIHHIAFRARDAAELALWQDRAAAAGLAVTEVRDRQYFRSIYFREPGGVLFEIATDPPGFALDEPEGALGRALKLPPWLEPDRAAIAARLPPLRRPDGVTLP